MSRERVTASALEHRQVTQPFSLLRPFPAKRLRWLFFFLALSMTVMLAHELTHHLVARAVCGEWGIMSWSTFGVAADCETRPWWIATMAGPLFTYVLIWVGALWRSRVGLVLIFANLPAGRIINVATRSGDELIVGRYLFGEYFAWLGIASVVMLILAWPIWRAWRRLPRQRRLWLFLGLLILPLFWDLLVKRLLLGRFLPPTPLIDGIPATILAVFATSALLAMIFVPRNLNIRSFGSLRQP